MAIGRAGLVAALDVGSVNVCCFIARQDGAGNARITGIGHTESRGVRAGAIVDLDAAEQAIRTAVEQAERMAGERIESVFIGVTAGQPSSETIAVDMDLGGQQIGEAEIGRLLTLAQPRDPGPGRRLLHAVPAGFSVDGSKGVRNPGGMYGARLGVDLHMVSAAEPPLRNLEAAVERCHLRLETLVAAPYAAGLAVLVEDETDLGVTLLDMGGGTTGIAVFYDGGLVHVDMVPIGGAHVTNDIARGLSTPTAHAERLKTRYGSSIPSPSDERETVAVPQVGEEGADAVQQVPRSILVGIIQPRIEETLELVRDRLERSGMARAAGRRLVLTGGGSELTGVRELAARVLNKQVRIGRPTRLGGLADTTKGPAFAAAAGLIAFAARRPEEAVRPALGRSVAGGRFGRIGRWLKENL